MKRTGHPKREDGYTMIFNELLEALMCADIPKRARRLIDVQMRFSFGCGPKTFTSLTKSEYATLANLDWSNTYRALKWLLEKKIFEQDEGDMKRYRLNKYYREWRVAVGLRDLAGYKDHVQRMVKKHLGLAANMQAQPGKSPDADSLPTCQNDIWGSGKSPDPQPVKMTDPGTSPTCQNDRCRSVRMTDELTASTCQNDRLGSVKTTDAHLSKRQMEGGDSLLKSNCCDPLKKRERKDKEHNEEVYSYFFVASRDLDTLLDAHPFFSALKNEVDFWDALAAAYPDQDIPAQLRKMTAWLIANPRRRPKNYKRFIQAWLAREERMEKDHGKEHHKQQRKDRRDSEEEPAPFSDFPPELVIR